jgi:predicted phage terminase large subunit-like protein
MTDTNELRRKVLHAALRNDIEAFTQRTFQTVAPRIPYQHNWHLDVLADCVARCLAGEYRHLAIAVPPRSLKSIMTSVALPALVLGRDPTQRIICASYDSSLAEKHARDCHAVMGSSWYRGLFPRTQLDRSKNAVTEFTTTRGGYRLATSVGGVLTGRGGNLIIVDDALKAADANSKAKRETVNQWFRNTLYSRLDHKGNDKIIVVMQRLHPDDLIGHLLGSGDSWEYLRLPAIAEENERFVLQDGRIFGRTTGEALHPDRESLAVLEDIKNQLGSYDFAAQYQQDPLPLEGGLINWSWFRTYENPPERQEGDFVTQSWDTAAKSDEIHDFSVCTTWLRRGDDHFLVDVARDRLDYPALKRRVIALARQHNPDAVLIEDRSSGTQLIQDIRESGALHPIAISPENDKITRMYGQSALIESGQVWLPSAASWLDDFRDEVIAFPHVRCDDQIDSLSQYLGWSRTRRENVGEVWALKSELALYYEEQEAYARFLP